MLTIHKVVEWEKGPKGKRVQMVQASFTDETGHHTNHFSRTEWERRVAAAEDNAVDEIVGSIDTEDTSEGVEEADVSDLRTDF
jgi:hypothetical protein